MFFFQCLLNLVFVYVHLVRNILHIQFSLQFQELDSVFLDALAMR